MKLLVNMIVIVSSIIPYGAILHNQSQIASDSWEIVQFIIFSFLNLSNTFLTTLVLPQEPMSRRMQLNYIPVMAFS